MINFPQHTEVIRMEATFELGEHVILNYFGRKSESQIIEFDLKQPCPIKIRPIEDKGVRTNERFWLDGTVEDKNPNVWLEKHEYSPTTLSIPDPLTEQHGGDHYKNLKIQPVEFIHANNLGFIEGCIVKYVARYKRKNGLEDLKKAKHFIDILIKLEYGE